MGLQDLERHLFLWDQGHLAHQAHHLFRLFHLNQEDRVAQELVHVQARVQSQAQDSCAEHELVIKEDIQLRQYQ